MEPKIDEVEKKTAEQVSATIIRLLNPHTEKVCTLTSDNGKEFARHEKTSKALDAEFYVAHPYSSWERGTNEKMNGLVRQYFQKHCYFRSVTDEDIQISMEKLNNRSRKYPGYRTPHEIFN